MDTALLVPGLATSTSASLWCGMVSLNSAPSPPGGVAVERASGALIPITRWEPWTVPDGDKGVAFARLEIGGLTPRSRERVTLRVNGQAAATAFLSTLPASLPGMDDPFRVMLGSCFCAAQDREGRLGRRFSTLPGGMRPELKLFCGDQVYLDSPFFKFLIPRTKNSLAKEFLENYAETWGQTGDVVGFQNVLSDGPTIFSSDDHEYWNNAPFPSFSVNTFTEKGRKDWLELARGLYSAFQTVDPGVRRIDIGDLSILIADTRIGRSDDRTTFLTQPDMDKVADWIQKLEAPGILVLGQPVFAEQAGIAGNIADWNLPDFSQYGDLCKALLDTPQSIVILTGDVHFGRVAGVQTPRGCEIVEIIASPMSLVTGSIGRSWHKPPARFPADPISGVAPRDIVQLADWERAQDHFATLELWGGGGGLNVRVKSWETKAASFIPVWEHLFRRI